MYKVSSSVALATFPVLWPHVATGTDIEHTHHWRRALGSTALG